MRKSSAPCSISVSAAASAVSGAMMTIGTWRFSVCCRSVRQICRPRDVRARPDRRATRSKALAAACSQGRHPVGDCLACIAIEPQPRGHGVAKPGFVLDQQNARARWRKGFGQGQVRPVTLRAVQAARQRFRPARRHFDRARGQNTAGMRPRRATDMRLAARQRGFALPYQAGMIHLRRRRETCASLCPGRPLPANDGWPSCRSRARN